MSAVPGLAHEAMLPRSRHTVRAVIGVFLIGAFAAESFAQAPPLHARIDEQVALGHVGPIAPVASDADFVRRIHLDLTGMAPAAVEARAFIADPAPDKRVKLIDRLLADPRHARHMANVFDVMWMERRADKHVSAADWQKYLFDSFTANKPYDQLVREVLSSDGTDPVLRPAAKFFLDRDAEPFRVARDVGRVFFGHDLQCAQCHDHPNIDDYYQADYHGLVAFFSRTSVFVAKDKDNKDQPAVLMDSATGEVAYQSVFLPDQKGNTLPKVLGGRQLEEPWFKAGEEYTVAPAANTRQVPKYSRRAQLAAQIGPANRQFNRNIANRLWGVMMGRGLVEPFDLHHNDNPPTHPQLLEMLTDDFVAMKYDMRAFVRELVLSQTYQRSIDVPADVAMQAAALATQLPALDQQQQQAAAAGKASAAVAETSLAELRAARVTLPPVFEELTKTAQPIPETLKAIDAANKALAESTAKLTPKQEAAKLVVEAAAKAKEAATKLPGEADLVEAAAKFEARSTTLTAEVAALAKDVTDKTAAQKASADKLAGLNTAVGAVQVKIDAARKQVIALEDKYAATAAKSTADTSAAALAKRKATEAKALVEAAGLGAAAQASQAATAKLAADLAAAKAALAKLTADLPALQAAQAVAQKANDEAAAAVAASKTTLDAKQLAMKEFSEVLAKADAAAQKLAGDAEVAATVAKLKTRSEQLTAELAVVTKDFTTKDEAAKGAATRLAAAAQMVTVTTTQMTELTQKTPVLEQQAPAAAAKASADVAAYQRVVAEIPDRWSKEFAAGRIRHLSPEQFAWSVLVVTGVYQNYVIATTAELDKAKPLTEEAKKDPAQIAARGKELEAAVYAKLAPSVGQFIALYGNGAAAPQTDFFATVDQALFLANGGTIRSWLAPSGDNLAARLLKLDDPKLLADEMYLGLLSRLPTAGEIAEVTQYLAARPNERPQAIQEMCWGLISSTEFRFNH